MDIWALAQKERSGVTGRESLSRGREFESQCRILDGHLGSGSKEKVWWLRDENRCQEVVSSNLNAGY